MKQDAVIQSHPAPKTISHSLGFRPGIDLHKFGQLARLSRKNFMILFDVIVFVHAHNVDSALHNSARR
jgi:hypothetical protein